MAATTATTTSVKDNDSKTNEDVKSKNNLRQWQACSTGENVKTLKKCMNAVKDEFFKIAKELFEFDPKTKEYYPTDIGICLLLPSYIYNGFSYYTGLVRLSKPGGVLGDAAGDAGDKWASIRASYPIEIEEKIKLEGFIIDTFSNLNYVANGQYEFTNINGLGGINKQDYPKQWQPCSGDDTVKLLKSNMNVVKDSFFEKSKEIGYDPSNTEYYPSDTGICKLLPVGLLNGFQFFIGLVQLSKPATAIETGTICGYYASVRVKQGVMIETPIELTGFIIDVKPFVQWVPDGVFRFGSGVKPDGKDIKNSLTIEKKTDSSDSNSESKSQEVIIFPTGTMDYLPTGAIQSTINSMKNEIKKKCAISGDLDTFQVVSATACNVLPLNIWCYYVKIYIGINEMTNFSEYIYVKYSVEWIGPFGQFGSSTYIESAQTFPF